MLKIALVQSAIAWGNVEENLRAYDRKFSCNLGCDLIILPEMFCSGSIMVKKARESVMVEKEKNASFYEAIRQKMTAWARCQNALVMGSTVCREGEVYYNRLVVAFPDGNCLYYDKRHCFSMGGECEHFSAGSRQLVFEFRGIKIAAFICYDLRFPVWSRNTQGYDLAVYVANWPESRREAWNALLRARAIENQAFVAAVNCVGVDNDGLSYAGDSVVLDAYGKIIAACREREEDMAIGRINIAGLHAFRGKFPVLDDRDHFTLGDIQG